MKNKKKIVIGVLLVVVVVIGLFIFLRKDNSIAINNKTKKKIDIDKVLKSKSYDYLPVQAKSYVKEVFEETGQVILTEKNKKKNQSYLNPSYVQYLVDKDTKTITNEFFSNTEKNSDKVYYGITPMELTFDIDYSKVGAESSPITEEDDESSLPTEYDLRNVDGKRYISSERNHSVGNSWVSSYSETLESKILKTYSDINYNYLHFSEGHANYATEKNSVSVSGFYTPYSKMTAKYHPNNPNIRAYAEGLNKGVMLIDDKLWKYSDDYDGKVNPEDVWNFDNVNYEVDGITYVFLNLAAYDDNVASGAADIFMKAIKQRIIDNGSIAASVDIFKSIHDNNNTLLLFQDANTSASINHGVQIIGWDDSYNYSLCYKTTGENDDKKPTKMLSNGSQSCGSDEKKFSGTGAWIIKTYLDDEPYGYMTYNSHAESLVSFTKVNKKDNSWNNIYNNESAVRKIFNYPDNLVGCCNYATNHDGTKYNSVTYNFNTLGQEELQEIKINNFLPIYNFDILIKRKGDGRFILLKTIEEEEFVSTSGVLTIDLSNSMYRFINGDFQIRLAVFNPDVNGFDPHVADYYMPINIYTKNADNDKKISLEEAGVTTDSNIRNNVGISDQEEMISVKGISRNLKTSDKIEYKMYKLNDINEPEIVELEKNGIKIYRNYSVSNIINTIITYNKEKPLVGRYIITASCGEAEGRINIQVGNFVKPMSGSGTENDPYIIKDQYQLDSIRNDLGKCYRLGNDIKFIDYDYEKGGTFYNDGKFFEPIKTYESGTNGLKLNGANYKIKNLKINRANDDNVGLFFGLGGDDSFIHNLTFEEAEIHGKEYVGSLAGFIIKPLSIDNVHVNNSNIVGSNYVGGLTGQFLVSKDSPKYNDIESSINNSYIKNIGIDKNSTVTGSNQIGGIFGEIRIVQSGYVAISNVSSNANVTAKLANGYAAGIVPNIVPSTTNNNSTTFVFNNVDSYGTIQGGGCHSQIFCEAKDENDKKGKVVFNNVKYLGANGGNAYLEGRANVEGEANSYEVPPAEESSNIDFSKSEVEQQGPLRNAVEKVVEKIVDWALTPLRKILNFLKS